MNFLASGAIVLVGMFVLIAFTPVGLFGALASSPAWRWGVFLAGAGVLVLVGVLASGRGDGQPAVVFGGRRGGSDDLADTDGSMGGLWLRSMLMHAALGVVLAWLMVTLINLRKRSR